MLPATTPTPKLLLVRGQEGGQTAETRNRIEMRGRGGHRTSPCTGHGGGFGETGRGPHMVAGGAVCVPGEDKAGGRHLGVSQGSEQRGERPLRSLSWSPRLSVPGY